MNESMHQTTKLWRVTDGGIKNGRKSECRNIHDLDQKHSHLVKNEYQTMKSTSSAHQRKRRNRTRERTADSINRSTISRSSPQHQIKSIAKAPQTLHTLDTNDGGAHYHKGSTKPCFQRHCHALKAGLYKNEAPQWLCYERWFNLSQKKHRFDIRSSLRTMKLAKIR